MLQVHPGASVQAMWCDARVTVSPHAGVVLPHSVPFGDLRWADLVMSLGQSRAGWAAIPWVLEQFSDEPVLVVDDTFSALGPLDPMFAAASAGRVVRAANVDAESGATWGPALGGAVVFPADRRADGVWWRARSSEAIVDRAEEAWPWWERRSTDVVLPDGAYRLTPSTAGSLSLSADSAGQVVVDGQPVALVDFAGFDPRKPWWYGAAEDEPTLLVSESPQLRVICRDHSQRLVEAGWTPEAEHDRVDLLPGLGLTPTLRTWYRQLLGARRPGERPPNPLVVGEVEEFVALLAGPGRPDGTGVSVHADLVMGERPDLAQEFSRPRWRDRHAFRSWLWTTGLVEGGSSLLTLPAPPPPMNEVSVKDERLPFGVNLAGYLGADLGLGVAARQLRAALEVVGVPTAVVSYDTTPSSMHSRSTYSVHQPYHFNLIVIAPDQLPSFVEEVGPQFMTDHYNIGQLYWECDAITDKHRVAFDLVDEVWAATTYLRTAFVGDGISVPVSLVPSPLVFDDPGTSPLERVRIGLDERFTFLHSFDFLSVPERKNPLGLVDAYAQAFGPNDGTRLILKSMNGHVHPSERERVLDAIVDRPDIELWDRLLSGADRLTLVAEADCYISLHRSEGLGLTMAEAMAVGTPVIATGYSGNLDFMDDSSALLVPFTEIEVGPDNYYPPHGHWAAPDLEAAAADMRRIRDDAALRSRISSAAKTSLDRFGLTQVGARVRDRLLAIWNT